jgi:DegV family protein with EDD domain
MVGIAGEIGIGIVTDSAANLPADVARELGIQVVPMYLRFGQEIYRDGEDVAPPDFYRRLASGRESASTSTPSPGDFLGAYERCGRSEIVCVTVASTMSSSHHEATLAARSFRGRVEVVDSMSASMAEGFVALEAARASAEGLPLDDVASRARGVAPRTRLFATVGAFDHLRRSGRVTKLQAFAATALDVKPVFAFREGEPVPVARPRTRRRALDRIVQAALAEIGHRPVHLAGLHAAAEGEATTVVDRIAAAANVVERLVVEATPVIGAHTGPGLVGVAFYCD